MSITLTTLAWSIQMATTRKVVLLKLCDRANDDGGDCYPSIKTIALAACISDRQTKRVIHWLIDSGFLHIVGNANGGAPGSSRRYQINIPKLRTGDTHVTGDKLARVTNGTETGDTGGMGRVTSATETGDTHVTQYTINTSEIRKSIHQEIRASDPPAPKAKRKKSSRSEETPMPNDFSISENVRAWAEKKGFDRLEDHYEAFVAQAEAKGYRYANWDAALRNAVLGDWAKIRNPRANSNEKSQPSITQNFASKTYKGTPDDQLPSYLRN